MCDTSSSTFRPFFPATLHKQHSIVVRHIKQSVGSAFGLVCAKMFSSGLAFVSAVSVQKSSPYEDLQEFPISNHRFYPVHLEIVGPLPPSRGYRYCLTLLDRFTQWPEVVPLADQFTLQRRSRLFEFSVLELLALSRLTKDHN